MPHIIAEYSANLEDSLDVQALVDDLHEAAIASQVAELPGIRSRAARRAHFRVADGNPATPGSPRRRAQPSYAKIGYNLRGAPAIAPLG